MELDEPSAIPGIVHPRCQHRNEGYRSAPAGCQVIPTRWIIEIDEISPAIRV